MRISINIIGLLQRCIIKSVIIATWRA